MHRDTNYPTWHMLVTNHSHSTVGKVPWKPPYRCSRMKCTVIRNSRLMPLQSLLLRTWRCRALRTPAFFAVSAAASRWSGRKLLHIVTTGHCSTVGHNHHLPLTTLLPAMPSQLTDQSISKSINQASNHTVEFKSLCNTFMAADEASSQGQWKAMTA